jgi:uncharacterized protein YbjT (DUF2867 family)
MSKFSKVVVLGGSGMIGARVVERLKALEIDVVAASRRTGVNTMTGEGLSQAFSGADVVVDASDVHSFDEATLRDFFILSGNNVAAAEKEAGVKHHVTLSIVGVDHLPGNPYYAAKARQELVAQSSGTPFTIVRSTQFFEFLPTIAGGFAKQDSVNPPDALLQPIAADDVGGILAKIALQQPENAMVQIAGPERDAIADWLRRAFSVTGDRRTVTADKTATWFGAPLEQKSLIPAHPNRMGTMFFDRWSTTTSARLALGGNRYASAAAELERQINV